ncbi:MAG: phage terminase large subunit [Desulfobacterales bacterium]|nr:phage terminase large subunit [Desulfobacterales bacterium]
MCERIEKLLDIRRSSKLTIEEKAAYISEYELLHARESFHAFRRFMHPRNKIGWFQTEAAEELQTFYNDLVAGNRPKLVIEAPPQHGKSSIIVDYVAWLSGKAPDTRTIYTSFSERLGIRANLMLQRMLSSEAYKEVFPGLGIPEKNAVTISAQKLRNREILEFLGAEGYFRNTTVQGSITGESLDLGVIDDPIRGRKDANSITVRNAVWDWFTDDFFTRFSEDAGLLCILTRWHIDDPIGRLIQHYPEVKVLKYKAIATEDEKHRKAGEPLFPELKSLGFLMERKSVMPDTNWSALYQQMPYQAGGAIIKGAMFGRYKIPPKIKWRACFGDTAQKKKEANDYQVAECWGIGEDGKLYLLDLLRDKFEGYELERRFPDFWRKQKSQDMGQLRFFGIEDKSSGTDLIQRMKYTIKPTIPVKAIPRSTDKYTRLLDVLGYIESGHVMIPENAHWVHDFISECESFTADDAHEHDDQIDPMIDAISYMLSDAHQGSGILVF